MLFSGDCHYPFYRSEKLQLSWLERPGPDSVTIPESVKRSGIHIRFLNAVLWMLPFFFFLPPIRSDNCINHAVTCFCLCFQAQGFQTALCCWLQPSPDNKSAGIRRGNIIFFIIATSRLFKAQNNRETGKRR